MSSQQDAPTSPERHAKHTDTSTDHPGRVASPAPTDPNHSPTSLPYPPPPQVTIMKTSKPASKSFKAAGGAAVRKKKATKKEKNKLNKLFREGIAEYYLKDFEHAQFEEGELEELLWTFIHADCGHEEEVVRFLAVKGLHIDGCRCETESPLVRAINVGKIRAVKALLKAGVEPNNPGDEVFYHAIAFKDGCMVQVLIEHGADVNVDSDLEGTALHYTAVKAVALDNLTCLKLFLEAGAKERSVQGDTLVSNEELSPTQYIQKEFGGNAAKAGALERAVNLLASYRD